MRKNRLWKVFGIIYLGAMSNIACVQDDLYDLWFNDTGEWGLPRNKKSKDIFIDPDELNNIMNTTQAIVWVNTQDFVASQHECLACALYNYGLAKGLNKTRYQMREFVGVKAYGNIWQYQYYSAVTQGSGVFLSDTQVNNVIFDAVGASNNTASKEDLKPKYLVNFKHYGNDILIEVNHNHYGLLQRVWKDNDNSIWYIHIKDQSGDGQLYVFSEITGVWY